MNFSPTGERSVLSEIRFRAARRVGEMMEKQRETGGLAKGTLRRGSNMDPREDAPSLSSAGIDKHLADCARKYAAIPDEKFETILAKRRVGFRRDDGGALFMDTEYSGLPLGCSWLLLAVLLPASAAV